MIVPDKGSAWATVRQGDDALVIVAESGRQWVVTITGWMADGRPVASIDRTPAACWHRAQDMMVRTDREEFDQAVRDAMRAAYLKGRVHEKTDAA